MSKSSKVAFAFVFSAAIGVGSYVGYRLATDVDLRKTLVSKLHAIMTTSKEKVEIVSEEVALKKAMMTNNPKVNQDWVDKQWEMAVS